MESNTTDKPRTVLGILMAGSIVFTLAVGFFCVMVWCVQGLWNLIIPDIFGLKSLSYIQAFGLTLLIHILFGSNTIWKSKNK